MNGNSLATTLDCIRPFAELPGDTSDLPHVQAHSEPETARMSAVSPHAARFLQMTARSKNGR